MDKRTVYHRIIDEDIPYARKPGLRSDTPRGRSFGQFRSFLGELHDFERWGLVFKGDEGEPVGLTVWLI